MGFRQCVSVEALRIAVAILAFSALSALYKVSQVRGSSVLAFSSGLYTAAFLLSLFSVISSHGKSGVPAGIAGMACLAGVLSVLTVVCVLKSLGLGGKLPVVTIIVSLSVLVPVAFSTVFLREELTLMRGIGVAMFVVFLVLLNEPVKEGSS